MALERARRNRGRISTYADRTKRKREPQARIESVEGRLLLAATPVDVLSYHGGTLDSLGVNNQETQLTPGNVTGSTFAKNFATDITDVPNLDGIPTSTLNTQINYTAPDGQAYGEPLVKTGVTITTGTYSGTVHDVVYVANELGSLFAIDANGGTVLWKDSFIYNANGNPNPLNPTIPNGTTAIPGGYNTETNSQDISPWICIVGTPVIDPTSNSIYLITNTRFVSGGPAGDQKNPHYVYAIHKINLSNGQDTNSVFADTTLGYTNPSNPTYTYNSGPYVVGTGQGSVNVGGQSRIYFNAVRQMVRPALEIYNGRIYMSAASHGDNQPYHGWVITFDPTSLAFNGVFNTTPNGVEGGIWSGGDGPVFDSQGNFYVEVGNGTFDGNFTTTNGVTTYTGINAQGFPNKGDYGDCFIKMSLDPTSTQTSQNINGWGIKAVDYFSPYNNQSLNSGDTDLGSGGPIVLPASAGSTAHPTLIVGAGKQGTIYLLDANSMGKFSATDAGVVQEVGNAINGTLSTPAYFNGRLYYSPGYGGQVASWALTNAQINTASRQLSPDSIAFPGSSPYISANGTQNGIVWVIDKGTGQLRAYNASNLATELWTSGQNAGRDALPGGSIKFSVATPVNGRVYALSGTSLVAYGPPVPPTAPPQAPTALNAIPTGASTIVLNWTDNSNNEDGFAIEQSTDGTNFKQINTVGVNVTTYTVSGLTPQLKYYFQVRAFNSFNGLSYSAYTNIASATTASNGTQLPVNLYHMDEGTGTTTLDSVSGNNGTLVGSPLPAWVTPGRIGSANLSFSGNGQSLQTGESAVHVANDLSPILGGTSSLDAWVKTTAVGSNTHWQAPAITGVEQAAAGNDINWGTVDATGHIGIFVGDAGGIYSTNPIDDGQWHNVAITRNATSGVVQLYVDGNLNATGTFDTGNKTSQFQLIGALQDDAQDGITVQGANFFNGQLDEVAIYNQVLTAAEVQALSTAPAAPSNLTVTPASGTELDLNWTDHATNATGYTVQRSTNNGPFVSLPGLGSGATGYNDTGLTPNTLYAYRVQATNSVGASAFSNTASATTPVPPQTPTNAQTTLTTTTEIDLKWTNNATNADGYRISRANIGGQFVVIANALPPTTTSYKDTGLTPGTEYDYHIQAYNIAGISDFAGIHSGTIAASPANLTATPGPGALTLTWTAPAYNGDGQNLTFNVYRGTAAGGELPTPVASGIMTESFTDSGLVPNQTYYYVVTAVDLGGESVRSNEVAASIGGAGAHYVRTDAATQGSWGGIYGADGYDVFNDSVSLPAYAQLATSGATPYTWVQPTTDPRALLDGAAASTRTAACLYSATGFSLDLNLTDGKAHQVAIYLLDWDSIHRTETVQVTDSSTGTVFDTRSASEFIGGQYLVYDLSGHVKITITNTNWLNAVAGGLFFDPVATPNATASFLGADPATQGSWGGVYGADGYSVPGGASLPSYARMGMIGDIQYVWQSGATDVRAPVDGPTAATRTAGCLYSPTSFSLDVNLIDGKSHQVALYFLDWDLIGRTETVQVSDANTGAVLDVQAVADFQGGKWLTWNLSGHVLITLTNTNRLNAVLSGVAFDAPLARPAAAATVVAGDGITGGAWTGKYGSQGYSLFGASATSLPAYARLGADATHSNCVWSPSTTDPRAPQSGPGSPTGIASCFYSASSFSLDLNLVDGQSHRVALYVLDWDFQHRAESIQIADANSGQVLNTQSASNFGGGEYLVWNITGHVTITISLTGGMNAVASGIFFG